MSFRLEGRLPPFNFRIDDPEIVVTGETIPRGYLDVFVNDVLQPALDEACSEARRWIDQQDIDTADSQTVDAILRDLGNPFEVAFELPLNRRKLLARVLLDVYKSKGTSLGMEQVIFALTQITATVVFPATVSAFILDEDELADTPTVPPPVPDENLTSFGFLGVSPNFNKYSFQIEVSQTLTDEEREILTEIVLLMKPAHTHFVGFIEPGAATVIDHWELGISFLTETGAALQGDEADLHDIPTP